jgi:MFS family permease
LGVVTEYYDIAIIAAMLPILTKVFLPAQMPPLISAFYVVGSFAVSYITRPIGALIWGHYSDRVGRRMLMIASMGGMAILTAMISVLPTYAQGGMLGLTLLVIIRMFVGIFYGGQRTAGVPYAMEFTPVKWRGLVGGLCEAGVGSGLLTSGATTRAFLAYYGSDAMVAYAWRYVFLCGLVPFIVVALVLLALVESPIWRAAKLDGKVERIPLKTLLKGDTRWRFLQSTLVTVGFLTMGATVASYVAPIMINLPSRLSIEQEATAYNVFALGDLIGSIVLGWLSQCVGRRRTLIGIAIMGIVTWIPTTYGLVMFGSSLNLTPVFLLAFWYGMMYVAPYPVFNSYLTERFGTTHRATGSGISYALGNMSGGILAVALVPALHGLLVGIETSTNVWLTVGCVAIMGSLIGLAGVYIGPETVGVKLEEVESEG